MRVQEAIEKADRLRPNRFSDMEKIEWLSMLDGQVYDEVISRYEENVDVVFDGYDEEHMNEDLLIPDTYAKVYVDYLMAQIDFYNRIWECTITRLRYSVMGIRILRTGIFGIICQCSQKERGCNLDNNTSYRNGNNKGYDICFWRVQPCHELWGK